MLVGVVSDTHLKRSDKRFFQLVETYFKDCDFILHAGDIVDIGIFSGVDKKIFAVKGNMDFGIDLPIKRIIEVEMVKIGLIHGYGAPSGIEKRVLSEFEDVDCIVFGHTHYPFVERVNNILLFNPGSAFDGRYGSNSSIGFIEVNGRNIKTTLKELLW
jgi:putative phosphoesterase